MHDLRTSALLAPVLGALFLAWPLQVAAETAWEGVGPSALASIADAKDSLAKRCADVTGQPDKVKAFFETMISPASQRAKLRTFVEDLGRGTKAMQLAEQSNNLARIREVGAAEGPKLKVKLVCAKGSGQNMDMYIHVTNADGQSIKLTPPDRPETLPIPKQ